MHIYERENWTDFKWDSEEILPIFSSARLSQGELLGAMKGIGFPIDDALLSTVTLDVIKSSEIEGIKLDATQVRSSVARHLGMEQEQKIKANKNIDGIVEMMLDATQNYKKPLTEKRIKGWQAALFPTGYNGIHEIVVGDYRASRVDIVSGQVGQEKIHFSAMPAKSVKPEMDKFLDWVNTDQGIDGLIKSAIAHFWFVTIHPFEDGNGRIGRAISDMLLARDENSKIRFYSMSNQLLKKRKDYYAMLGSCQNGDGNITGWIKWFLTCFNDAVKDSQILMNRLMDKVKFWNANNDIVLNERQVKVINKLLDGFDGKLTTSKWAKLTGISSDTALRDIKDLVAKDILRKTDAGGRSTSYVLITH